MPHFILTLSIPAQIQDCQSRPRWLDYGLQKESAVCLREQSSPVIGGTVTGVEKGRHT